MLAVCGYSAKPSKCEGGHGMVGDTLHSTIESRQKLLISKADLTKNRTINYSSKLESS